MRTVTLQQIKQLALSSKDALLSKAQALNRDIKIYAHWTAGRYMQFFEDTPDYQFLIDGNGTIYLKEEDLSAVIPHTYMRNSGAVAIALCAAYNGTTNDLGDFPPTAAQIEALAQLVAVLIQAFNLICDINHVLTHAEAADNKDGLATHDPYGPDSTCERWDLWFLKNDDAAWSGGDIIRGKANFYLQEGS